jgi:hypothetical protein
VKQQFAISEKINYGNFIPVYLACACVLWFIRWSWFSAPILPTITADNRESTVFWVSCCKRRQLVRNGSIFRDEVLLSNQRLRVFGPSEWILIILYFSILLRCIVQWVLQVMLPSACSFIVFVFTVFHYMFRPTWQSSGVWDVLIFIYNRLAVF